MENASKALIIAGAILISILLITVGIAVMNSAGSATDDVGSTADSMARQTFNAQFTAYEGSGKSANDVKALFSLVRSSNGSNGYTATKISATKPTGHTTAPDKYVYVYSKKDVTITSTSELEASATYTIEITGYSTGGYVQKIQVTKDV